MSLSQTVSFVHISRSCLQGATGVVNSHHILVAVLSLLSIYLLGAEIYDRNFTDKRVRLMEHDAVGVRRLVPDDKQKYECFVEEPDSLALEAFSPASERTAEP